MYFYSIALPIDKCTNRRFNKSANYSRHCLIRIMLTLKFPLDRNSFALEILAHCTIQWQRQTATELPIFYVAPSNREQTKRKNDTQPKSGRWSGWIYSLDYRVIVHIQLCYWMIFILPCNHNIAITENGKNRFKQFFAAGCTVACWHKRKIRVKIWFSSVFLWEHFSN